MVNDKRMQNTNTFKHGVHREHRVNINPFLNAKRTDNESK